MPVWHRDTQAWRDAGELAVAGITQEQHPDRCRLFAQWHGIDWPILWDPFNVTGSQAVPFACAVDEHGVIRSVVRDATELGEGFLERAFDAPPSLGPGPPSLFELDSPGAHAPLHHAALRDLLLGPAGPARFDAAVSDLRRLAQARPEERPGAGALHFQAGVALRMRADSPHARPGDFQAALDHWAAALRANPNQYVWRRRIQQYGPRLDKPYPFYGWVAEAQVAIRARGEEPVALVAPLTGSELAAAAETLAAAGDATCPDPDGGIERDDKAFVAVDTAVAWDTSGKSATATVHLALTPSTARDVHWTNDAGPLVVWLGTPDLPEGWRASNRLLTDPGPPEREVSNEPRRLDVEVRLPAGSTGGTLEGFALYYVCEGAQGECVHRRLDFAVDLRP